MARSQVSMASGKPAAAGIAASARKRSPRRTTSEVLERIVAAASVEFQEHGFAGARTAAIAQRAGVVEALIFNHFGSKENLFQRAMFEQLDSHFSTFVEEHPFNQADRISRLRESREYIAAQQDFLRQHHRMFKSLFVNEAYGGIDAEEVPRLSGLQDYIDKMVGIVEAREGRQSDAHVELTARISFATVLACALFRNWLFPAGIAGEEEIRDAVTDFVMEGAKANIYPR
jgi:AcrR family transcriptional regulator